MEAKDYYVSQMKRFIHRATGINTHGHEFGNGSVTHQQSREIDNLPVDTTYLVPLRNMETGERLYPADYLPADSGPAQ